MALRRNVRLRREYLYRKSLEGKERENYERKLKIKAAITEGKALPTELRNEERALRREIELEDEQTAVPRSHIDDEYAQSGLRDPKVCVTTSREPSARLKQFAKELRFIFPNAQRMNRGGHKLAEVVEACRNNDFSDLIVVQEHRGEPTGLIVSHLPYGPTAYFNLANCVLRHDIEGVSPMSEAYPHLLFHNFSTPLGQRCSTILKHLFPVPKPDSKRVITFANERDWVSFRHHTYAKEGKEVALHEVGPRLEMMLYQVKLGTVEQREADTEWVLRPYMNTAKKRRVL